MMRLCTKCGDYYADPLLAFCLADGTPLVGVETNSERWAEGAKVIEKKEKALTKRKQIQTLRRVSFVSMVLLTMLVYGLAAKRYVYFVPRVTITPTPTPSPTPLYKITGRVMTNGGPLGGVNIMLKSAKSASTKTDSNGNYTFAGLPKGGSYTITPERATTTFTPPNRTITNLTQDGSADFSAVVQPDVYKISGRVTEAATAKPLTGVKIILKGATSASTTTDSNGKYSFADLPKGGSYTITPDKEKTTFTPRNRAITNLTQDGSADFSAVIQPDVYKISGRVTEAAMTRPLTGVDIMIKGAKSASTTTDSNGKYSFADLPKGGNYTITAHKEKLNFTPPSRAINNLMQDASADFSGLVQPDLYKISGRVTETATGRPLSAVNITLRGARTASTKTDPNGNYSFGGLPGGARYTITPEMGKINFMPPSRSINNLARDESADFSGLVQPKLYKITGRVMDADKPLGGVSIKLGGSTEASTTTDANGTYRFSDLPAGGSYIITPERARMNLTPRDHSIRSLMRDESADFSRAAQECSAADQERETNSLIEQYSSRWKVDIEKEERNVIKDNAGGSDGEPRAALGKIAYHSFFFNDCRTAVVTASYRWQITIYLPNALPKVINVQKKRTFLPCYKTGGVWSCPLAGRSLPALRFTTQPSL